jgi:aminopeptidase N
VFNNGNPFEIVNYVYPEDFSTAQEQTLVTVDIMDFFAEKFEEYPFSNEKYGHAQFGWGGGMEHTTVSFMGNFSRGLIAHELAHQWFGNKITCGSWQDIWLNEGLLNI